MFTSSPPPPSTPSTAVPRRQRPSQKEENAGRRGGAKKKIEEKKEGSGREKQEPELGVSQRAKNATAEAGDVATISPPLPLFSLSVGMRALGVRLSWGYLGGQGERESFREVFCELWCRG